MAAAPNFFIVGAPKSGTTALWRFLAQHPSIFMSPIKEPNVFAPEVGDATRAAGRILAVDDVARIPHIAHALREKRARSIVSDWSDYLSLFRDAAAATAVGEASVAYLASVGAPAAIRQRVPDAKIVMILRDPVDRLFSYYVAASNGESDESFADWALRRLAEESTRSAAARVISAGRYATHLSRYMECFGTDRVHVMLYDDFVRTPAAAVSDLLAFLGVDPKIPLDLRHWHNITRARHTSLWRRSPGATPADRARVIEIYEGSVRELAAIVQRDLSPWLDPCRSFGRGSAKSR